MRRVILGILAVLALVVVALAASACTLYVRADVNTVGELGFENELAIPPLLEPQETDGRRLFDLTLQRGRTELVPGKPAETWGVNGAYLGPTLRARRGDRVELRVRNQLPEATTVHWHGMHLPAEADGGPHQLIERRAAWTPSWEIDQPAATLWYHPHPDGETADHVYRGIAGMFILDAPEADALPLPDQYGVNDIPLIIQDKRLQGDGSLDFSQSLISPTGRLGGDIVVNGTHSPYLAIGDERVRFRLLNASNARVYNVGFADDREFDLIATDGGLLATPRRIARIQVSPGERAEVVVAFEPGERVVLRSFQPELGTNFWERRFAGGDDRFDLLQVRAADALAPAPAVPVRLARPDRRDADDAVGTRHFRLSGTSINGSDFDPARIDEVVEAGATEIWEVENASGTPHSFHPHGVSFRVLEYGGGPPPSTLPGWKDTVYVRPGDTLRLLVRFGDYPDSQTSYMLHCHVLQHEDRGMMGQFVLVRRGQQPGDLSHGHDRGSG